jgi:uncharacterized protein YkwD
MAQRITAYMCSSKPNVLDAPSMPSIYDLKTEYDEDRGVVIVTAYIHQNYGENEDDCLSDQGSRIVETKMMPLGRELIPCIWGDADSLSWNRGIVEDDRGQFQYRNDFLTIEWENPSEDCGLCFWKLTMIAAKNPLEINFRYPYIFSTAPESTTGMIPESGNKADYWISDASTELHNEPQPNVTPGEIINVVWYMLIDGELLSHTVNGLYYNTPLFTGGEILSVQNEGTTDLKYSVKIEGTVYECMPTDFAQYEVGSWVYVLKQGGQEARTADRRTAYSSSTGTDDSDTATMIERVNEARADNGLYPLRDNTDKLEEAAQNHAKYMAVNDYHGHSEVENNTAFTGETPGDRLAHVEYLGGSYAENVSYGQSSDSAAFASWMDSDGHRANILSEHMTEMGYAKVESADGTWYYCQVFGDYAEKLPEEIEDLTSSYRLIPVTMGQNIINADNFETIDYDHSSNFPEVHDLSYHDAVIKEVSGDYATIGITIQTGDPDDEETEVEYSDVPIFYHCMDSATVSGGGSAFAVDDEVLVLNEGGSNPNNYELTIVGFKNKLKRCGNGFYYCIRIDGPGEDRIIVWRIRTNENPGRVVLDVDVSTEAVHTKFGIDTDSEAVAVANDYKSQMQGAGPIDVFQTWFTSKPMGNPLRAYSACAAHCDNSMEPAFSQQSLDLSNYFLDSEGSKYYHIIASTKDAGTARWAEIYAAANCNTGDCSGSGIEFHFNSLNWNYLEYAATHYYPTYTYPQRSTGDGSYDLVDCGGGFSATLTVYEMDYSWDDGCWLEDEYHYDVSRTTGRCCYSGDSCCAVSFEDFEMEIYWGKAYGSDPTAALQLPCFFFYAERPFDGRYLRESTFSGNSVSYDAIGMSVDRPGIDDDTICYSSVYNDYPVVDWHYSTYIPYNLVTPFGIVPTDDIYYTHQSPFSALWGSVYHPGPPGSTGWWERISEEYNVPISRMPVVGSLIEDYDAIHYYCDPQFSYYSWCYAGSEKCFPDKSFEIVEGFYTVPQPPGFSLSLCSYVNLPSYY